jgi:thymidylate kinase
VCWCGMLCGMNATPSVIAIEGGEGTGKDTVLAYIKKEYAEREDVVFVREPGGQRLGKCCEKCC